GYRKCRTWRRRFSPCIAPPSRNYATKPALPSKCGAAPPPSWSCRSGPPPHQELFRRVVVLRKVTLLVIAPIGRAPPCPRRKSSWRVPSIAPPLARFAPPVGRGDLGPKA